MKRIIPELLSSFLSMIGSTEKWRVPAALNRIPEKLAERNSFSGDVGLVRKDAERQV
jgi:hypothetical protein